MKAYTVLLDSRYTPTGKSIPNPVHVHAINRKFAAFRAMEKAGRELGLDPYDFTTIAVFHGHIEEAKN